MFISYAQESDELANAVLALANQMRQQDGIDAWIARYEQQVPQGWRLWMTDQIARAKFVLVVSTAEYALRTHSQESGQ